LMSQSNLFPVKLTHEEPTSGTKDLKLIGFAIGNVRYAVKRECDGALLPLAEWIGHHLSRLCGIATPDFAVVECLNGDLAFGSRWEENSMVITPGTPNIEGLMLIQGHAHEISKILGLDCFLPNCDRHAGNFIFVNRAGKQICLSMDFSLSSVRLGLPFGKFPLTPPNNTDQLLNAILINHFNKLSKNDFNSPLNIIHTITMVQISSILDAAPTAWFTLVKKKEILDWWVAFSSERAALVEL
jgi:hypothetical protein